METVDADIGTDMAEFINMSTIEIPTEDPTTMGLVMAASRFTTFKMGMALHRYYLPSIVIIGFIGNFLSLAVMLKPHNRQISCCVYMLR